MINKRKNIRTTAVIGKNYGDEGKGLVTASLCSFYSHPLVIKHNGGAQAGHTVENSQKKIRFIHHQIGSGAEYGADTLFAENYHPDLFQLPKEMELFESIFGFVPKIYSEAGTKITTIDDVIINMALETKRGDERHGSCGMGIDECTKRISAGFAITVAEVKACTQEELLTRLKTIREEYTLPRLKDLEIDASNPYFEMISDENILINFAKDISDNISLIETVAADEKWLAGYDGIIFETGQGLLLDEDYLKNAPHLTSSKTGITEPVRFLEKRNMILDEAVYVTRPYVTRHGAGPLPAEFKKESYPNLQKDMTNEPNEWQGTIRYARHESVEDFLLPIKEDIKMLPQKTASLAVTHLDETKGMVYISSEDMSFAEFLSKTDFEFKNIYCSFNHENIELYGEKKYV